MDPSFFLPGDDCEATYSNLRDMDHNDSIRAFVEDLWTRYQPSHDLHFLQDAKSNFHQRFWEMYLFAALQDIELDPKKGKGAGPDFSVVLDGRIFWIEAVAPRKGDGPDQVPEFDWRSKEARRSPHDEIQLRYASAILDKARKWPIWISKGYVAPGDGFVVAVNGRSCNDFRDGNPPLFVRACLGIGPPAMVLDRTTGKVVDGFYTFCDAITKKNGEAVSTGPFLDDSFSAVSGVLHSLAYYGFRPTSLLEGMEFLHNPMAVVSIPDVPLHRLRRFHFAENRLHTLHPHPAWPESPVEVID